MRAPAALFQLVSRVDSLITRERVRNYSWILLITSLVVAVPHAALGRFPVALSGEIVFPDYLAHWTGGRLLLEGREDMLYDPAFQLEFQRAAVPGTPGLSWFVSPPVAAGMYLPLAWLPYGTSALLWTGLMVGAFALCLRLVRPLVRTRSRDFSLLVLAFTATPAVFEVLGAGQDSLAALLILVVGLRLLLAGRDGAAGATLALGIVKPHLFVLVPVALLIQKRYRASGAFVGVAFALVLASVAVVGVQGWLNWVNAISSPLYAEAVQVHQTWKMQSVSALGTALGAPHVIAYATLAIGCVALAVGLNRSRGDTEHVWALTLMTTVVFSPHVMVYDLVILLPVATYCLTRLNIRSVRVLAVLTILLLWSVPIRQLAARHDDMWTLLAAPWSAVTLLLLWVVLMRWMPTGEPAYEHRGPTEDTSGRRIGAPRVDLSR
jgi:hypothetical protein